jgi:predicted lipid-binding transport protein (Tim44 family)
MKRTYTGLFLAFFAFLALVVLPGVADARFKSKSGFGSRGSKTFSAPRATPTAPRTASPIQQTRTPRSSLNSAAAAKPGLFGGMSKGGFMAGLVGAGLLGALFGYGLSGGLGGIGAFLGLIAQVGLLVFAAMFLFSWLRKRNQPTPALARSGTSPYRPNQREHEADMARSALSGASTGQSGNAGTSEEAGNRFGVQTKPLVTKDDDFAAFEQLLIKVQEAYANEDVATLHTLATEEMCDYFQDDIADNQKQGQASRISGVKLLQGDLSEAWKERDAEYATVAMRFELADAIVDRKSGRVIDGSLTEKQEMIEIWTFVRQPGGSARDWKLTAVQGGDGEE